VCPFHKGDELVTAASIRAKLGDFSKVWVWVILLISVSSFFVFVFCGTALHSLFSFDRISAASYLMNLWEWRSCYNFSKKDPDSCPLHGQNCASLHFNSQVTHFTALRN
jgi:hypothetical protein